MALQADDPRSQAQQIADDIRAQIDAGGLPVGSKIPSVRKLAVHYGVSNGTAQSAVQKLQNDGVLHSKAGKGLFVSERPTDDEALDQDPKYRKVMDRIDTLSGQLDALGERLAELEADRAPRRSPARRTSGPGTRTST